MTEEKTSPVPKRWRDWTKEQRQQHVHQLRIVTPQMKRQWDEFDTAVQMARRMGLPEPYFLLLIGESGTGKSTLVQEWRERNTPDVPSLYIAMPVPATLKSFLVTGLAALGDPRFLEGTTREMAQRFSEWLKATEMQMIFVDDIQHLIERTGTSGISRSRADVLSFLFQLSKDLNLPLVLIGLPETLVLLQVSPRWERRLYPPRALDPYDWDAARPETVRDFCRLMHAIDQSLPLDGSDLGKEEMAARFFLASKGILSQVMRLVRTATLQAIEEEASMLSLEGLARAYEQRIANTFRSTYEETTLGRKLRPNPFRDPLQ